MSLRIRKKSNRKPAIIILITVLLIATSCIVYNMPKHTSGHRKPVIAHKHVKYTSAPITIVYTDTTEDGRPLYSVFFSDSTVLDAMYPEEIAQSLIDGEWKYNEDLKIH